MIRTFFIFMIIFILAWLSIDYFNLTLPTLDVSKKEATKEIRHITFSHQSNIKDKSESVTIPKETRKNRDTLDMLLKENKFYDALSWYLEHGTQKERVRIEEYLDMLAQKDAPLALEYMNIFLENEPQSSVWKSMITTYIKEGEFSKAIALIMQEKENYVSESEDKRLNAQLRDTAIKQIDTLLKREEYGKLITFLEEMIAYDDSDNFYTYRLAKLYMHLDKTQEAAPLLEGLKYDEVYAQNVKTLLNEIDNDQKESYEYAIPLLRYGDHYVANVFLDGTSFSLMLDTGATFIFIDEDKASMLEVIRDDLVLETAGNNVNAKLCNAHSMKIGNLELSNIEVTTAPFKRDGIDGLLGMNFFKQFTFFINQDEDMLYLNPKK